MDVGEPQRLQHVPVLGVLRDVGGEAVGDRLVAPVTSLRPRTGTGGWKRMPQPSGANQHPNGSNAAPVAAASRAGPLGTRAGAPKRSTVTPESVRSRSASRQTTPPERSLRASRSVGDCAAPVSGTTSKPSERR